MRQREVVQRYCLKHTIMWMGYSGQSLIIIFNHFFYTASLLLSQIHSLNIETYLFEIIVTFFNIQVLLFVILKTHNCGSKYYWAYYLSGVYVLTNLFVDWVLQHHYFTLTFTINYSTILTFCFYYIKKMPFNPTFMLIPYVFEVLLFLTLDNVLTIDIRWSLMVPLLTFFYKFYKQFGKLFRLYKGQQAWKIIYHIRLGTLNDGSLLVTIVLPFIFYFYFTAFYSATIVATIVNIIAFYLSSAIQSNHLFQDYCYTWECVMRVSSNRFKQQSQALSYDQHFISEEVLCEQCNLSRAIIAFNCGHLLFCKKCYQKMRNKQIQKCCLCQQPLQTISEMRESFGSLLEHEYREIFQKKFYHLYPKINQVIAGFQPPQFFREEGPENTYLHLTSGQPEK